MKQYLELLDKLLTEGVQKGDRTGTGTLNLFGAQMRFDLNKGFPLCTTKKMFTRGIIEELRWFIEGSTDVNDLIASGVNFWNFWMDEEGSIGHGYGKQLRRLESFVPVKPKIYDPPSLPDTKYVKYGDLLEPDYASDTGATAFNVGDIHSSLRCGDYIILRELPAGKKIPRIHWEVGFLDSGYARKASYGKIQKGVVNDRFRRTVFGVGYYGNYDKREPHFQVLVDAWREMLRRCYYVDCKAYRFYGAKGVHVDPEWHCFATFQNDAKNIPGWYSKLEYPDEYSLDKDVLWASNRYSKHTCCWASHEEQSGNRSGSMYFKAVSKEGEEITFPSIGDMAREFGTNLSAVHRCLNGKLKTHHGWRNFQYIEVPEGYVMRYRHVDQLKDLIAEIKHNPNSRRLVITFWNPQDMSRTTLPCCHGSLIQFDVTNGKLSCAMVQRSADALLGLPVNLASYALLTRMIAQQCNLEVGELVWTGTAIHLYQNHIAQAQLQLTREPRPLPTLKILRKPDSIFDYKYEDFELVGYDPHPAIKAEVSV